MDTVLITGAAGGLGFRLSERFLQRGNAVAMLDRSPALLDSAADRLPAELSGRAHRFACDITDAAEVAQTIAAIEETVGPVRTLVNSAGIVGSEMLWELSLEAWHAVIDVNVHGAFYVLREVAIRMVRDGRGGKIVNIASLAGRNGGITVSAAYSTSKAALIGLTKSAARQLAGHRVNVNAVAPGPIDSDMLRQLGEANVESLRASVPLARLGTFDDTAGAVLYLCSPEADHVTGVTLDVNGGLYIAP